ncbi:MAG TPA: DoxX family membrane protein, partial [Sphingomicrobium sp.]|nr:DoxX family membrane protein [Sphingomicrobium sp.]
FPAGDTGMRIAHLLYGLALIAFGFSHFAYMNLTAPLIPKWLPPSQTFWAYFTGAAYLAAGLAIVTGIAGRIGAVGSALMMTLITLIVWGPGVASGKFDSSNWQEPVVSWALTAAAWLVAASFERYTRLKPLGFGGAGRPLARS